MNKREIEGLYLNLKQQLSQLPGNNSGGITKNMSIVIEPSPIAVEGV